MCVIIKPGKGRGNMELEPCHFQIYFGCLSSSEEYRLRMTILKMSCGERHIAMNPLSNPPACCGHSYPSHLTCQNGFGGPTPSVFTRRDPTYSVIQWTIKFMKT